MHKKQVVLKIPRGLVGEPFVYKLVKDYNLIVNVLRAQVMADEEGKIVLEISGEKTGLENGLRYLKQQGVHLDLLGKDISLDASKCIDCGSCTSVCTSGALAMNRDSWKLEFARNKCVLCGLCVNACPMRAIDVTF